MKTITPGNLEQEIIDELKFTLARDSVTASRREWWIATSMAIQRIVIARMMKTLAVHNEANVRRVYYLSMEFLMGRLFVNNMLAAGVLEEVTEALRNLGHPLEETRDEEYDMALGNGGLGRLAACFLDSLATLDLPAIGYGIHYEYGLFKQEFRNGYQVELPDGWIQYGSPWEIIRPQHKQEIPVYGHLETVTDNNGNSQSVWTGCRKLIGVPYDIPIPGYGTETVNFLRLWESKAPEEFDLDAFNRGGYEEAVRQKNMAETISKVLYPNDHTEAGKELRLLQQYFFVACSLRDIVRRFQKDNADWDTLPDKVAIQLNDTHPAIAIPELQRLLTDEFGLSWKKAWGIVTRTFAYTNHTLMPEALEKWSAGLFRKVLPRHLQIILEINKQFLDEVEKKWPGDSDKKRTLSLIEEGNDQMVRMGNLSVVGSHSVNGVAAIHTELIKTKLFPEFHDLWPQKINNKTNGITPRRWLLACNPRLADLITRNIGGGWERNLERLRELEPLAEDASFREEFMAVKHANKVRLAKRIFEECGIEVDPSAMFDVQIKRLHEYKRQHLNLLHILFLYHRLIASPNLDMPPRVFIFAAKAAPGYDMAKLIIKAINAVGAKINADPRINGKLKVAFMPNYRVSLAQRIVPAADLSEQISTAGKEASGTGNMKLALNGAVTIGTLDGANVEIREEVGDENIFIFGRTVDEVHQLQAQGYNPAEFYKADPELAAVIDWLGTDYFTEGENRDVLAPLRDNLLYHDPFLCLADFASYCKAQELVSKAYVDKPRWAKMAVLNTARVGKFSSDRTIAEYAKDIWKLKPVKVG
ncbi:MAG: glycogen/starch/alpha-glucan phosphorylase [Chthoniobacterales bacterium]|jgi:starch phosphorylase